MPPARPTRPNYRVLPPRLSTRVDESTGPPLRWRTSLPLERVRACIALRQFVVTRRAELVDGPRVLPPGTIAVFETIRSIVASLEERQWRFRQEKGGTWVDVYRVEYEGRSLWLKLRLELNQHSKEYVVVVSFHEWDETRPI